MKVTVTPDEKTFDRSVAWSVIGQILSKPDSVIGLSTGRTTGNLHRLIASIYKSNPFPVDKITFFGLDEVMNVDREYSGACYKMLKTELIDDLGIDESNFLMLPTRSDDFERDCKDFTRELKSRGGIDLLILGLGENGHLGFNQPGSPFENSAWTTCMNQELEERIRRETGSAEPLGGVTLGISDIMNAKHIILVAKGDNKAGIVRQIFTEAITTDIPATVLRLHPNCEYILDSKAAYLLPENY